MSLFTQTIAAPTATAKPTCMTERLVPGDRVETFGNVKTLTNIRRTDLGVGVYCDRVELRYGGALVDVVPATAIWHQSADGVFRRDFQSRR